MAQPSLASSIGRAALAGLGAALVLSGIWFLIVSTRTLLGTYDCGTLLLTECGLEEDLARQHARLQLFTGMGFELLACGVLLTLRERQRADAAREGARAGTGDGTSDGTMGDAR